MRELVMIVDELKISRESELEATLHAEDPHVRFGGWFVIRASLYPDVGTLQIGDRLRVTIEKLSAPVSDVEKTIEEAERSGLSAASLV